jgi:alkylhydroperoxidase family enzyme
MMSNTIQSRAVDAGSAEADTSARTAEINGRPPRISALAQDQISKEAWDILNHVRGAISSKPAEKMPEFTATVVRHPDLYRAHMELGLAFFKGALAVRDREIAIIRIGWLCQAPFEFGAHVKIGKREGKLTDEEVARILVGAAAPGWGEKERALLRAVEELMANAMISDDTWAVLAKHFNEKQLIELPLLVGQYQGVAYLQNTLRIRLEPDNLGLSAR